MTAPALVCHICLWAGRDTPNEVIPDDQFAMTVYQGNAYCVPHYHERRQAVPAATEGPSRR